MGQSPGFLQPPFFDVILRKRRPSQSEGLPTKDLCTGMSEQSPALENFPEISEPNPLDPVRLPPAKTLS